MSELQKEEEAIAIVVNVMPLWPYHIATFWIRKNNMLLLRQNYKKKPKQLLLSWNKTKVTVFFVLPKKTSFPICHFIHGMCIEHSTSQRFEWEETTSRSWNNYCRLSNLKEMINAQIQHVKKYNCLSLKSCKHVSEFVTNSLFDELRNLTKNDFVYVTFHAFL